MALENAPLPEEPQQPSVQPEVEHMAVLAQLPSEEREAYWYEHVYRGDVKQLTGRAIIMGMALGAVLSISNLYVGLKTGFGFGVAITAGILAFAIFKVLERILPGGHFTDLENNAMQSVASAAGFMASAGLVSAVPALLLLNGTQLAWPVLMIWITAISLLGVVVAVPLKRQMINVEQLPFPSGIAAAETIKGLHGEGKLAMAKAKALGVGALLGAIVAWMMQGGSAIIDKLAEKTAALKALAISIPAQAPQIFPAIKGIQPGKLTLGIDLSLLLYAAGAIIGIRTGLSLALGAVVNWMFIAPWLIENKVVVNEKVIEGGFRAVASWTTWPSTAMMIVVTLIGLSLQWKAIARTFSGFTGKSAGGPVEERASKIEVPGKWFLIGILATGGLCVILQASVFGINPLFGVLAVGLAVVLSMVTARVSGETDIAPTGAMGKVTQLMYAAMAPGQAVTNLMTANVSAGAAIHTADLLTDLKSGYVLGAKPRQQFLAQLFGVAAGTLVCVPAYLMLVPNKDAINEKLPIPGAIGWEAAARALGKGFAAIPPTAYQFMVVLVAAGVLITLLEIFLPKARKFLPSAIGFGMAMVLPFSTSLAIAIGAIAAWLIAKAAPTAAERYTVPVASGLIAGESIMAIVVLGISLAMGL